MIDGGLEGTVGIEGLESVGEAVVISDSLLGVVGGDIVRVAVALAHRIARCLGVIVGVKVANENSGAIILFSITIGYTVFLILRSRDEIKNNKEEYKPKRKWWLNLIFVAVGLAGIIFGGDLVVDNASFIAGKLGMSDLLVGLTIVAVGTSLPELVTSIVAAKKGENDIAVGNAIGSSLFNIVLILGFCSVVTPATVEASSLVDCLVMLASAVLVFLFSFKSMKVNKWQGIVLLIIYVAYVVYIVLRNIYHF